MRDLFRLDPRALAWLRIGTGLVLLWDMGRALAVARDWWALQGYTRPPLPDLLVLGGGATTLRLAAVAVAAVAVALILGWRTRVVTVAAWAGACAYQFGASASADYHNAVLCTLLLWSLALPTGVRWSLDARAGGGSAQAPWLVTIGSAGLVLSLAWIYLATAAAKSGTAWWGEGTAVWYALLDRSTATAPGRWLAAALPGPVLQAATWAVLALEWIAGPLLLWPRTRAIAVAALAVLHLSMWVTMDLGSFPLVMLAGLGALLPGPVWDRFAARLAATPRAPTPASDSPRHRLRDAVTGAAIALALAGSLAGGAAVIGAGRRGDWSWPGARQVARLRYVLGLEWSWTMYAPEPNRDTGWWVALAWRHDGRVIDLLTSRPPTLMPPGPGSPGWRRRWMALGDAPWRDDGTGGSPQAALRDYLRCRREGAAGWQRLALVWVHEPLIPFQAPQSRRPLLVLAWPAGAVSTEEATAALGAEVGLARFDAQGELRPPPLSAPAQSLP